MKFQNKQHREINLYRANEIHAHKSLNINEKYKGTDTECAKIPKCIFFKKRKTQNITLVNMIPWPSSNKTEISTLSRNFQRRGTLRKNQKLFVFFTYTLCCYKIVSKICNYVTGHNPIAIEGNSGNSGKETILVVVEAPNLCCTQKLGYFEKKDLEKNQDATLRMILSRIFDKRRFSNGYEILVLQNLKTISRNKAFDEVHLETLIQMMNEDCGFSLLDCKLSSTFDQDTASEFAMNSRDPTNLLQENNFTGKFSKSQPIAKKKQIILLIMTVKKEYIGQLSTYFGTFSVVCCSENFTLDFAKGSNESFLIPLFYVSNKKKSSHSTDSLEKNNKFDSPDPKQSSPENSSCDDVLEDESKQPNPPSNSHSFQKPTDQGRTNENISSGASPQPPLPQKNPIKTTNNVLQKKKSEENKDEDAFSSFYLVHWILFLSFAAGFHLL